MSTEDLVSTLKHLQKTDPYGRQCWIKYVDKMAAGVRDPTKHDASVIQDFLAQYESGAFESAEQQDDSGDAQIAELIKVGQRKSTAWKTAWHAYCSRYGHGMNDPMKHPAQFLVGFLEWMGQQAVGAGGIMSATQRMGKGRGIGLMQRAPVVNTGVSAAVRRSLGVSAAFAEPARKRARTMQDPGGAGSRELVDKIKTYQRQGPEQKKLWWAFCDERHHGVHDPARHSEAVLQEFCTHMGI
eukprot:gnl/MRDRNA2_/MRDRNA2_103046_c0_seq1.p1 gnl/MRDRNA2_/MRDRNA2_103046_c0~~gnl/MRDRNA2_/MRDRNA2_103046_c0_seq1.p1  ORF type:complete len:241 (-),score=46.30 gnl/MRDRNA2_/MRDRNA2_103046_c0_seq1:32-754(-)